MLRIQRKDSGAIHQGLVQGDHPVSDYNRINAVVKIPAEQLGSGKMGVSRVGVSSQSTRELVLKNEEQFTG